MNKTIDMQKAVVQSEHNSDQIKNIKTIYDISGFEIFWRNFLAGMSRTLGSIILLLVFLLVGINVFLTYAYPQFEPLISEYRTMMQNFNSLTNTDGTPTPSGQPQLQVNPDQINQIINTPEFQNLINQK